MLTGEEAVPHQDLARSRLEVYRFLLVAFDKPTAEQHRWFWSRDFRAALEAVGEAFGLPCPDGELVPPALADHESRYLACFEVGVPQPPVVLQASHYNRREPVPATVHEHVLFYKRFGACLAKGNIEPADHLSNELAFLIHLDELFAAGQLEAESVLRARRDFLARQVTRWAAAAAAAAAEKSLPALYRFLLAVFARAAKQDLELTQDALAGTGEGT
jgi:DMSO reductase family type II enzyme chaperone